MTARMVRSRCNRPVRVAFLIDQLSRAGTESQLLALIRDLDRSRIEPLLILLDGQSDASKHLEPLNCPVVRLGVQSLMRPHAWKQGWRLMQVLRERQIDITQIYFLDSLYFGVPLAKLAGVRKVLRVRNNLGHFLTPWHNGLGRIYGRMVDATLTNSASGQQALMECEGLPSRRIMVLENGVDLERFRDHPAPFTRDRSTVRIGLVGNLRRVKNIDGLIRAAVMVRESHPECRFEVAGEGEQRAELQSMIDARSLNDHFVLRGSIGDVPAFLAEQDIAILCSHSEGMSNALLEYMASGRAIVATTVGGNAQLVHHEQQGLLIPAGDDRPLADAMRRLIDAPSVAQKWGAAARKRVEAEYSREAMRERFEDYYESLMK